MSMILKSETKNRLEIRKILQTVPMKVRYMVIRACQISHTDIPFLVSEILVACVRIRGNNKLFMKWAPHDIACTRTINNYGRSYFPIIDDF